jgi:hypothetical protein
MAELALVVETPDAGVDVGLLVVVDPAGWDPFGEPVAVDAAAPAFVQEMRVVVSAQQSQVFKVGRTAENPIHNMMPVAPLGWVGAAGK